MVLTLEDEINSLIQLVNLEQRKLFFIKMVFEDDSNNNNSHDQDTINHDDHQISSHYFDSTTNNDNNNNKSYNMDDIIIASNNNNKIYLDPDNPIMSNNDNNLNQDLVPCPLCDRKFISDRLEKHLIICKKIKEKKRKLFDAAKQRAENLDKINNTPMEISVPPTSPPPPQPKPRESKNKRKTTNNNKTNAANEPKSDNNNTKQSNWRQQHQEFIRTIRAARGAPLVQDGDDPSLLESESNTGVGSLPPGIVECPTCSRRFSIKAADRHINWCAENVRKQKEKTNHNQNNNKNQEALERMKARTKYKPLLPGTNKNDSNPTTTTTAAATPKRTRSLPRSNSSTTLNASSSQNNLAKNNSKTTKLKDNSNPKNTNINSNRRNTKVISKSSENLSTKKTTMIKSLGPASKRTPISNNNQIPQKKITNNNHSKSKVDSGIGSGGYQKQKNKEKSAPIMKFKEKFPNHHHQNNVKSIIDQFQDIEHILRRNSTAFIDDSPKTVPGVRTGGISPVKNMARNTPLHEMEKSSLMSKSETSLHRIDDDDNDDRGIGSGSGDIKTRIDQYITRLYDNNNNNTTNNETTLWQSQNNMTNGLINGYNGLKLNSNGYHHGRINEILQMPQRQNSANSDTEARMSTSDSTDSGLGVVLVSNNNQSLLETVNETDGKISSVVGLVGDSGNGGDRSSSKNSARTFRADVLSPTMSDIETNNRLLLRNSSLNDIEILNGDDLMLVGPNPGTMINSHHHLLPRFCHQCGTKYPNVIAKFCYECGSRRFETV